MTYLIPISLSGAGMKLHTSKLGTFLVYTQGLSMLIFKKKSLRRFLGKSSKLWVLHKKLFLCNTQSSELFPRNLGKDFFLKISILSAKVYTTIVSNIEYVPHPLSSLKLGLSCQSLQHFTYRLCKIFETFVHTLKTRFKRMISCMNIGQQPS